MSGLRKDRDVLPYEREGERCDKVISISWQFSKLRPPSFFCTIFTPPQLLLKIENWKLKISPGSRPPTYLLALHDSVWLSSNLWVRHGHFPWRQIVVIFRFHSSLCIYEWLGWANTDYVEIAGSENRMRNSIFI